MRVNEHFADEMVKVLKPDDIVWVHRLSLDSAGQGAAPARAYEKTGWDFFCTHPCRRRKSSPPCPIMSI